MSVHVPVATPQAPSHTLECTPAAVQRVRALVEQEGNPALKLRVAVDGGGCSGFQYDVHLDAEQAADDVIIERDGVTVLVDRISLPYLEGAELDFVESLAGSRFVVRNPNARATCGCGTSFTL